MFINFINIFKEPILTLPISSFLLHFYLFILALHYFLLYFLTSWIEKLRHWYFAFLNFFSKKAIQDYHFPYEHSQLTSLDISYSQQQSCWNISYLLPLWFQVKFVSYGFHFPISLLIFWNFFVHLFSYLPREVANISHYDPGLFYFLF